MYPRAHITLILWCAQLGPSENASATISFLSDIRTGEYSVDETTSSNCSAWTMLVPGGTKFWLMLSHHPSSFGFALGRNEEAHWIFLIRISLESPFSYVKMFIHCWRFNRCHHQHASPANNNQPRNTETQPIFIWRFDSLILKSFTRQYIAHWAWINTLTKLECWGTSFFISLSPDHPMTQSWSCRKVRPTGANQNTTDKLRVLWIGVLIFLSPEHPMTPS